MKSKRARVGGLCAIRHALPPTERSACALNRLIRSATATPTPPNELWSQKPRILTGLLLMCNPVLGSKSTERTPTVTFTASASPPDCGLPPHGPGCPDADSNATVTVYKLGSVTSHNFTLSILTVTLDVSAELFLTV